MSSVTTSNGVLSAVTSTANDYIAMHSAAASDPILTTAEITAIANACRVIDSYGRIITDADYVTTYDLTRAVVQAWELKAAKASGGYLFITEGMSIHRQQIQAQCLKMAQQWKAKCFGTMTITSPGIEAAMRHLDNQETVRDSMANDYPDEYRTADNGEVTE